MKTRKRELAKVGVFGSIDNPTIVTETDLREIAETFPDIKKAPIKLGGHWSGDRPRLANVVAVEYDDKTQTLRGTVEENDALSKAVEDGFYPDVSIGAKARASDGKMYLHHLAYLGDEPPAIKDLEESIQDNLSKSETEQPIAASDRGTLKLFPGTAEKRLYLSDEPQKEKNKTGSGSSSDTPPVPEGVPVPNTREESTMDEKEVKQLQDENAKLKAENEQKEKLLSDAFKSRLAAEKQQLEKSAQGKIPQAQLEKLLALADGFGDGRTIELSDGENKKTVSPVAVLADVFAAVPLPVEPGAFNLSDTQAPNNVEAINFSAI